MRKADQMTKGFEFATPAQAQDWLRRMHDSVIKKPGLANIFEEPQRIFNADETGFQIGESGQIKVIGRRSQRKIKKRKAGTQEMITCLCMGNAKGATVPPFLVIKGPDVDTGIPRPGAIDDHKFPGVTVRVTDSGWMNKDLFLDAIIHFNLQVEEMITSGHTAVTKPVLLIIDGANCHLSAKGAQYATENGITIWVLPPNTTSQMQPMDIGYNQPLKTAYYQRIQKFAYDHPNEQIRKPNFCVILKQVWDKVNQKPTSLINAFDKSGIFPYNPRMPFHDRNKDSYYCRPTQTVVQAEKEKRRNAELAEMMGPVEYVAYNRIPDVFPVPSHRLDRATVAKGVIRCKFGLHTMKADFTAEDYDALITTTHDEVGNSCRKIPKVWIRPENILNMVLSSVELNVRFSDGTSGEFIITPHDYIDAIGKPKKPEVGKNYFFLLKK